MNDVFSVMMRDKLVLIARGIRTEVLSQALAVCANQGITLFESTFDHRLPNCLEENREKLKELKKQLGDRLRFGTGTVLNVDEVRAAAGVPVILLTPTLDANSVLHPKEGEILMAHAEQIRPLASEYEVGLCDPCRAFQQYLDRGGDINELLA